MLELNISLTDILVIFVFIVLFSSLIYLIYLIHSLKRECNHSFTESITTQLQKNNEFINSKFTPLKESLSKALFSMYRSHQKSHLQLLNHLTSEAGESRKESQGNFQILKSEVQQQLSEMRTVVDEKLQKTLNQRLSQSSEMVSSRLDSMHNDLGQLQSLTTGINDLKNVLSNVKTRGILGEVMLESLLSEMFSPNQYSKNVSTKKGSQANVEFALRMPSEAAKDIWLPIDSKFPLEAAQKLMDSKHNDDLLEVTKLQKEFSLRLKRFAKDISTKYIDPPHTTSFAVMFLPTESLFLEVLNCDGLFQVLQREYKVTVTGPTTLSAFFNSLKMGFHSLNIQKHSHEIMNSFIDLKKEFATYSELISKAHKQVGTAYNSLSDLEGVRMRAILRKFEQLEGIENQE